MLFLVLNSAFKRIESLSFDSPAETEEVSISLCLFLFLSLSFSLSLTLLSPFKPVFFILNPFFSLLYFVFLYIHILNYSPISFLSPFFHIPPTHSPLSLSLSLSLCFFSLSLSFFSLSLLIYLFRFFPLSSRCRLKRKKDKVSQFPITR